MQYRDSLEGNGQFLASRTTEVFYPTVPIKTFIVTNGIIIKKKKTKQKKTTCFAENLHGSVTEFQKNNADVQNKSIN